MKPGKFPPALRKIRTPGTPGSASRHIAVSLRTEPEPASLASQVKEAGPAHTAANQQAQTAPAKEQAQAEAAEKPRRRSRFRIGS